MKRVIGLVLAFGAASCSVALNLDGAQASSPPKKAAPPPPQINYKDLAPADEYFGPLKLSILGIRNTTTDAGKRYFFGIKDADSTLNTAAFIDASLHDWAHKYPKDLEVARALYFLQRLYSMVDSSAAQTGAKREASWMFASYAKTPQAKQLRRVLAAGPQKPVIPSPLASPTSVPPVEPAPAAPTEPVELTTAPPERPLTPAPDLGSPEPMKTGGAAPLETSPSDGFPARTPSPIPDVSLSPEATPSAIETPSPSPSPVPTRSPSPRRGSSSQSHAAPTPVASPTDSAFPYGQPLPAETPYPSSQQGAPTPFPTPVEPSAADIDGSPRPTPIP